MKIQIKIEKVYGVMKAYPVCEKAQRFAAIAGTKTLTYAVLQEIAKLGIEIQIVPGSILISEALAA